MALGFVYFAPLLSPAIQNEQFESADALLFTQSLVYDSDASFIFWIVNDLYKLVQVRNFDNVGLLNIRCAHTRFLVDCVFCTLFITHYSSYLISFQFSALVI